MGLLVESARAGMRPGPGLHGAMLAAAAILGICGCAAGGSRLSKAEVDAAYRGGLERFEAGDFRAALRRFQLVREARPQYPQLQRHLGICYAKLGMASLAVESLRRAVREAPEDPAARLDLAVALEMAGDLREAEGLYLARLAAEPSDPRAVLNLGLLYVRRLEQPDKGRSYLERYLELEPGSPDAEEIRRWLGRPAAPAPPAEKQRGEATPGPAAP